MGDIWFTSVNANVVDFWPWVEEYTTFVALEFIIARQKTKQPTLMTYRHKEPIGKHDMASLIPSMTVAMAIQ